MFATSKCSSTSGRPLTSKRNDATAEKRSSSASADDRNRRLRERILAVSGVEAQDAQPFVRWAGGKRRLLRSILPFVPSSIRRYHEPFVGGGAMFFAVSPRVEEKCFLADLNPELGNAWAVVRDSPADLLDALEAYRGYNSEDLYYEVREQETPEDDVGRAARFLYLNQTAWNGLWRVNGDGKFNVPWGNRPFRGFESLELAAVSAALQGVHIETSDFRESLARARKGDFVYIDPPYLPISDTSKFAGYTKRRFRLSDLKDLADCCRDLTKRGARWIVSNRDNATVRELFEGARIVRLTTRRSVAAQNRRDVQPADSPEAIIVGGCDS